MAFPCISSPLATGSATYTRAQIVRSFDDNLGEFLSLFNAAHARHTLIVLFQFLVLLPLAPQIVDFFFTVKLMDWFSFDFACNSDNTSLSNFVHLPPKSPAFDLLSKMLE